MAGYSYVNQVTDPNAKKALQNVFDLIAGLRTQLDALQAVALRNDQTIDANGQRIINVPDPQANTDAASAGYVRAYSQAQLETFKGSLGVSGTIDTTAAQLVTVKNGLITEIV